VVDLRVALDEAGQQVVGAEVVGNELEGGEAERAFEYEVVERHEPDFGREVAGSADELLVGVHERDVEDLAERGGDAPARAFDVVVDEIRCGDDLVLEARVELHVARFVDLLGGEECRFPLGAVRPDEPGELGGDSFFGDHQRRQREQEKVALPAGERGLLLLVDGQVNRERRPLRLFPASVERLGVVQFEDRRSRLACADDRGRGVRMDLVGWTDLDVPQAGIGEDLA
jgi:hypothetical protein